MKVCSTCWNYENECTCNNKCLVDIDDDIADIVIQFNRVFDQIHWPLKTRFCCAGHIMPKHRVESDWYATPHSYVSFVGNYEYFHNLASGLEELNDKLRPYDCYARQSITPGAANVCPDEIALYVCSCEATDNMTLREKLDFLHAKILFFEFLYSKIEWLKTKTPEKS